MPGGRPRKYAVDPTPEDLAAIRERNAAYHRQYRAGLSDEVKKRLAEKSKLRMRAYYQRRKDAQELALHEEYISAIASMPAVGEFEPWGSPDVTDNNDNNDN